MTENGLITLYINIEDFYHRFIETKTGKKALSHYYGKRGPKRRMTAVLSRTAQKDSWEQLSPMPAIF